MSPYYWTDSVFVRHILLHISGSWLIRVRLVHSWAGALLRKMTYADKASYAFSFSPYQRWGPADM